MRVVAAVLLMLAGCGLTPEGDLFRAAVREEGKTAAAKGLSNAEWYMCRAASVGAIKDRYGHVPDKVTAYMIICKNGESFTPIIQPR